MVSYNGSLPDGGELKRRHRSSYILRKKGSPSGVQPYKLHLASSNTGMQVCVCRLHLIAHVWFQKIPSNIHGGYTIPLIKEFQTIICNILSFKPLIFNLTMDGSFLGKKIFYNVNNHHLRHVLGTCTVLQANKDF